jgi:hypothetical protein
MHRGLYLALEGSWCTRKAQAARFRLKSLIPIAEISRTVRVLPDSEKASAALSRRCLQAILRDKGGVKHSDFNEIEEAIKSGSPPDIVDALHPVRTLGNFAAHPMKSTSTGTIIDVEPGEAEWTLEVIERLFDFYFVGPAITAKRKAEINKKLAALGKPPIP